MLTLFHAPQSRSSTIVTLIDEMGIQDRVQTRLIDIKRFDGTGQRDPANPHGPRTLDIDLIQVGRRTSETDQLTLPHPRAHERAFVLVPWLEIDRRAALPQGHVDDLVATMDTSGVSKVPDVSIIKP